MSDVFIFTLTHELFPSYFLPSVLLKVKEQISESLVKASPPQKGSHNSRKKEDSLHKNNHNIFSLYMKRQFMAGIHYNFMPTAATILTVHFSGLLLIFYSGKGAVMVSYNA